MTRRLPALLAAAVALAVCLGSLLTGGLRTALLAKEKTPPIDPNDVTYRLFQFLDTNRGGKLADFYVIADVYRNPANPSEEHQHILRADYDKNRGFGKLNLYVRSVGKIAPDQLRAYTPKEFYEFGLADDEKFMKTEAGPFGKPGDVYLRSVEQGPLGAATITDEVKKAYEAYVGEQLLPALQKK